MSALAWLFGLGALAVALPFLFHLIRQTPQGKTNFSSLMFLRKTPPRLTKKSRLQDLLLLLLRAAVLILLALAFMRPFIRSRSNEQFDMSKGRDILLLIDTSASMQRGGVWDGVRKSVEQLVEQCESGDQLALATFDDRVKVQLGFPAIPSPLSSQTNAVMEAIRTTAPGNGASNVGQALAAASDLLESRASDRQSNSKLQIVLITDQQLTPSLTKLQNHQWPDSVRLEVLGVNPTSPSNAAITGVGFDATEGETAQVRLMNGNGSNNENFSIRFGVSGEDRALAPDAPVYVAAGNTKTLPFQRAAASKTQHVDLLGDDDAFDNRFYFSAPPIYTLTTLYLGDDDPTNPNDPAYFLKTSLVESPVRQIKFVTDPRAPEFISGDSLVVVTKTPNQEETSCLEAHLRAGGKALFVLTSPEMASAVGHWTGLTKATPSTANTNQPYSLLMDVDFSHEIFRVFNAPGLNDFTQVKFWDHLDVELDASQATSVIARFDDHQPAIWETSTEQGSAIAMAAHWHPDSSQLATSSKFPILMNEILDWSSLQKETAQSYYVNQPIPIGGDPAEVLIYPPGQTARQLGPNESSFTDTATPGLYRVVDGQHETLIAVNIAPSESLNETFTVEQLEAHGVKIGMQVSASTESVASRRKADVEIEGQQKMWKWLIIAAICFLFAETFIAAHTSPRRQSANNPATES